MENKKDVIKPSDITHQYAKYGVIDRLGNYYHCEYSGHNSLANRMKSRDMLPEGVDCYNFFSEYGWLILTGSIYTKCEFIFDFNPEKIEYTQIQVEEGCSTSERVKISEGFKMSHQQLKAILDFKKSKEEISLDFNFSDYNIVEFLEECENKKWIDYGE